MYSTSVITAIAATLFASANAHFFISQPVPIPGSAPKDPLDASGANFPCHGADLSQGTVTPMAVGSSQPLNFDLGQGANTAVHGGGSCQISLTYETDATKQKDPANWKVIQSFVGGCPTNAPGNLPTAVACDGSNSPNCVPSFSFKIPSEVQDGNAILAWTWFNNIGNREMYMNCAKVSISGGSNKLSSLPNMMVANLASVNTCKTTETFNTDFPSPGNYVTKDATLNYPLKLAQGDCGSGSGSGSTPSDASGSDSGTTGGAASSAPAAGSGTTPTTSAANDGQYTPQASGGSGAGGIFAPGASSAPVAAAPTATSVIATTFVTSTAPAATSAPVASTPSTGSTGSGSGSTYTGTCTSGQVSCTASGFYCIDATTFGMCAWGCATPMQMSAGTQCSNSAVVNAVVPSRRSRRSIRHLHQRSHGNVGSSL